MKWVLSYSTLQDCFHIEEDVRMLRTNRDMCIRKNGNDFLVVGFFDSIEKAQAEEDNLLHFQALYRKHQT